MAQKYKAVLTKIGAAKIAEKHHAALNKVIVDPKHKNYLVAELVIPPEIGGFWMRELGLYDEVGALIAVSNMAESYKPLLSEGSGRAQTLRMVVIVSDMDTVNLLIDSSTVLATQEYVDEKLLEHEQSRRHPDATLKEKSFTQLSSATNSTSEVLAATPKAVKAAYDKASEADKNAQTANDNAGKANDNANTRLEKSKNLSDLTDKPKARKNLELGTAATSNAQKSATDGTANALMANGAWGLGGAATFIADNTDLHAYFLTAKTGYYSCGALVKNGVFNGADFIWILHSYDASAGKATYGNLYEISSSGKGSAVHALAKGVWSISRNYSDVYKPTPNDVDAWPIATRGNIGNGILLSSANQVGVYLISISKPETVSDFPKIGNTPLYGYGFMLVTKNGAAINQFYMPHHGPIANRQSWNNETGYNDGWNVSYGTANKPTASDVGALPIGGGTLNGNLTVKNQIQVGGVGNAVLNIGDNDSGLRSSVDGQVDLYVNNKKMGYWNGNILSFTGQMIPTNYSNFDAKYHPKGNYQPAGNYALVGSSYTKVESDTRYYTKAQSDAGYAAQSSVYSKTASDARYVQDIRQSGIMNLAVGSNANTQAPAGGVVIGAIVNGTWDNNEILKYTWLQKNVNGTWLTIGRV
ncbi:phage tail protein [Hafnia alvei]|uniref:phage tail protein n=1 Tax=Hafnia alvei TaxID=569 RepID=UPI001033F925|nr:phage tail protein [Hafnia alvei]TBL90103.1 hypothetical protein EYY88_01185 [Hafnia alvei]